MLFEQNRIKLSDDPRENLLSYDGKYYRVDFLNEQGKYVQGGNGIVFKLIDEQEGSEFVIKFIKFPEEYRGDWKIGKRINRFEREIEALSVAKENGLTNVIQMEFNGEHIIGEFSFQYYVMQKCDCNLNSYLSDPEKELDIFQKTLLCQKILSGIISLHDYKIYHRDIKHDNIFFIGNEPLIGDLGLADYRDSDIRINERGELIGPTGWFSPEAVNKFLVERTANPHDFDCIIDEKSEMFQLGKLFWYIYQGNIPIGQIHKDDFKPNNAHLFELLFNMLIYSKKNRYDSIKVKTEIDTYLTAN